MKNRARFKETRKTNTLSLKMTTWCRFCRSIGCLAYQMNSRCNANDFSPFKVIPTIHQLIYSNHDP